jgi:hypothetical protein
LALIALTFLLAACGSSGTPDTGRKTPSRHDGVTDYGSDVALMAKETGLTLPRLSSLAGYALMDAFMGRSPRSMAGLGAIEFGPAGALGGSAIVLNVAAESPGHPGAPGNVYRQFYSRAHRYHRAAGIRYTVDEAGFTFPYHGEWIYVTGATADEDPPPGPPAPYFDVTKRRNTVRLLRAIVSAPTVG